MGPLRVLVLVVVSALGGCAADATHEQIPTAVKIEALPEPTSAVAHPRQAIPNGVRLYSAPDFASRIEGVVPPNWPLKAERREQDWVLVRPQDAPWSGWLYSPLLLQPAMTVVSAPPPIVKSRPAPRPVATAVVKPAERPASAPEVARLPKTEAKPVPVAVPTPEAEPPKPVPAPSPETKPPEVKAAETLPVEPVPKATAVVVASVPVVEAPPAQPTAPVLTTASLSSPSGPNIEQGPVVATRAPPVVKSRSDDIAKRDPRPCVRGDPMSMRISATSSVSIRAPA